MSEGVKQWVSKWVGEWVSEWVATSVLASRSCHSFCARLGVFVLGLYACMDEGCVCVHMCVHMCVHVCVWEGGM